MIIRTKSNVKTRHLRSGTILQCMIGTVRFNYRRSYTHNTCINSETFRKDIGAKGTKTRNSWTSKFRGLTSSVSGATSSVSGAS